MTGSGVSGRSRSLSRQINAMEKQIMLRHHRVQTAVMGIKRQISARMVSPVMLLAAAGIGVVMEQTSRRRGWSLAAVLDAANASIRLFAFGLFPYTVSKRKYHQQNHS